MSLPVREAPVEHFVATQIAVCNSRHRLESVRLNMEIQQGGKLYISLQISVPSLPRVRIHHISVCRLDVTSRIFLLELVEGALIIRLGFWGRWYYNCNKEPPKIVLVIIEAPTVYRLSAASCKVLGFRG